MKKIYVKPMIEVELAENDEMLMASGPESLCDSYVGGGARGMDDAIFGSVSMASGGDDEWDMGAKSASFSEDFEYSLYN